MTIDRASLLGTTLNDRFRLDRGLGSGKSMVFVGTDLTNQHPVAIKLPPIDLDLDSGVCERFLVEGRLTQQITHRNFVRTIECEVDRTLKVPYLATELTKGPSVAAQREIVKQDRRLLLTIVLDILAGMNACHKVGLVLRDVKPTNFLLIDAADAAGASATSAYPRAVIVDFGLARAPENLMTAPGDLLPHYQSPEQCRGRSFLTAKSDVYCLGILLIELLTGQYPYPVTSGSDAVTQLAMCHIEQQPCLDGLRSSPELIPFIEIVSAMVAKKEEDRPEVDDVSHHLQSLLDHEFGTGRGRKSGAGAAVDVESNPDSLWARFLRRVQPVAIALGLVIALGLAGVGVHVLWGTFGGPAPRQETFDDGLRAWNNGDTTDALRIWTPLAKHGEAAAAYRLGLARYDGTRLPRRLDEARRWFQVAADGGHDLAQFRLAQMILMGEGGQGDTPQAVALLKRAANAGIGSAAIWLTDQVGVGAAAGNLSPGEALAMLTKAAETGDSEAACRAANLLLADGRTIDAEKLLKPAAAAGHIAAQARLGMMLLDGVSGPADPAEAVKWLETASTGGNAPAMVTLARACAEGLGVATAPERAIELWRRAADLRESEAMAQLAAKLSVATRTGADRLEAEVWLTLAARLGHATATRQLPMRLKKLNRRDKSAVEKQVDQWLTAHPAAAPGH